MKHLAKVSLKMTNKKRLVFAVVGLGLTVLPCCGDSGDPKSGDVIRREGEPPVTYVAGDDPKMTVAFQAARDTADQFAIALTGQLPGQTSFSVKVKVKDGKHVEFMWMVDVEYRDGVFYGKLGNEPNNVKNVKLGDEVKVAKSELADWMYVDKGVLRGGYTIRVLRDNMSEVERKQFDQSVPFKIE